MVYAKPPFGGPGAVLAYLSRYTHRIAIANSRLVAFDGERVTFKWKDYRAKADNRYKLMTLDANEFIRRFLIHVLPDGSTGSVTTASSPMPIALAISHWPAGCSVYPTQPRRAARATAPSRRPRVERLSLLRWPYHQDKETFNVRGNGSQRAKNVRTDP